MIKIPPATIVQGHVKSALSQFHVETREFIETPTPKQTKRAIEKARTKTWEKVYGDIYARLEEINKRTTPGGPIDELMAEMKGLLK
jgi:hypothetical protein